MVIVAVRVPAALGSKVTVKVVLPAAATEAAGCAVTVKSAAFVPLTATSGVPERVRAPVPVFWIVKVRATVPPVSFAPPKSVKSALEGVVSPSAIEAALPTRLISGAVPVPWMAKS